MTMPLEMQGIDAKIRRALETIQTLDDEIGAYLSADPKPYRILKQVEEEGRAYSWLATLEADVPLRFSVLAGEIVHHLRSSLDHHLRHCAAPRQRHWQARISSDDQPCRSPAPGR